MVMIMLSLVNLNTGLYTPMEKIEGDIFLEQYFQFHPLLGPENANNVNRELFIVGSWKMTGMLLAENRKGTERSVIR